MPWHAELHNIIICWTSSNYDFHLLGSGLNVLQPQYNSCPMHNSFLYKIDHIWNHNGNLNGTSGPPLPHFNDPKNYGLFFAPLSLHHFFLGGGGGWGGGWIVPFYSVQDCSYQLSPNPQPIWHNLFSFEWCGVCRVPVYELYFLTQIF